MKFSQLLREYSQHKRSKGLSGKVTLKEARILKRNALKAIAESKKGARRPAKPQLNEAAVSAKLKDAMKKSPLFKALAENFHDYKVKKYGKKPTLNEMRVLLGKVVGSRKLLEDFSKYKVAKYRQKPTIKEMISLLEKATAPKAQPKAKAAPTKEGFRKYVEAYKAYKRQTKGTTKLNETELVALKKKYLSKFKEQKPGTFEKLVENYKKYKKAKGLSEAVSYGELKTLKAAFKKNPRIREAGEEFAADPNAAAPADPMAAGADPNAAAGAAAPVAPEVTAAVQGLKDQIDSLAQQVGIQDVNDNLGADAASGIPPVDGQGGAPGADGAAPVMESRKGKPAAPAKPNAKQDRIAAIRERIAKRAKALKEESDDLGGLTDAAHEQGAAGIPDLGGPASDAGASGSTDASPFASLPSAQQVAAGVDGDAGTDAGDTWPTKDNVPGEGKALQGDGAKQVTENVDDVTKRYVDRALSPKLNFNSLKEALKSGRLG